MIKISSCINRFSGTPFNFVKKGKIEYLNLPISFDIETTSTYIEETGEKFAFMYAFVFVIDSKYLIGRTWQEFKTIIEYLETTLQLNSKRKAIIYIHNLSYEFQFLKTILKFKNVLSYDDRHIISAETETIIFKCSYVLSGYSLDYLGSNILQNPIKKLKGNLDYSKIRHSNTYLYKKEVKYIINDGLIVDEYIREKISQDGNIVRIPLTKTGYVRKYTRDIALYGGISHHGEFNKQFFKYRKIMKNLTLTLDDYEQLKRAFHGGFTHANGSAVNRVCYNVVSFDFTSSYPYVLISEKFPMSKPYKVDNLTLEIFYKYNNLYCTIFDIEFKNLRCKVSYETPISVSKCFNLSSDFISNNGRLVSASTAKMTITNVDFKIITCFYTWDEMYISNYKYMLKAYLPRDLVLAILELYKKKTELKGIEDKEIEYLNSKEMINACYGMTVTDIIKEVLEWNQETHLIESSITSLEEKEKMIEIYNKKINRHLFYAWGVWVTAYAQYNLFTAISRVKEDYIYSDTDSIKFLNYEKHAQFFIDYNNAVERKLKLMCEKQRIDFNLCKPKTKEGKEKLIGVFDREKDYSRFKTLGAKRYMYEYEKGNVNIVVSGLNKSVVVPYLKDLAKKKNVDIFDLFKDGLYIPAGYTGKNTHTYIDYPLEDDIKDYQNKTIHVKELSGVHLSQSDYELSLTRDFINYILGFKEDIKA